MAQDIEVSIKVDGSQSERALGTLKSQLREAQNEVNALSDKFGATSVQAVNAARKAAELKDRIGDAKALTDAFNPDAKFKALSASLGGVAGGFAAVQGGMNLLGVESSATEEALLKVQSAMALSQGAQAVGESVDSFRQLGTVIKSTTIFQQISTQAQRLWNLTMSANPIGAVVLAITALLTAGYALVNWYKSSSDETKKNTQAVSSNSNALDSQRKTADKTAIAIKKNGDYQIEMAKASGASAEAVRNLELKLIDEQIAFANSSRELAKNTYYKNKNALASLEAAGAEDELIAAQKENTQKALEEFGKQTKNLNDANAEKIQLIRNHNVEKKQAETNHNKEVGDEAKKAAETARQKEIEAQQAFNKEITDLEKNKYEKLRDIQAKSEEEKLDLQAQRDLEEIESLRKKGADVALLMKQYNETYIQLDKELQEKLAKDKADKQKEIDDKEKEKKKEKDQKTLEDKLLGFQLEMENETVSFESKKQLILDREALLLQDQTLTENQRQKIHKESVDAQMAIDQAKFQGQQALYAKTSETLTKGADLLGKNTAAGKSMAVAAALINTYQGITAELATKTVTPFEIGLKIANVGIIAATGFKAVKNILAVKTPGGGGSGGGGSMGSISTPATVAPNVNVVGASRTNAIAETIAQQGQQPIKAYVVANDVTTQQGLNRSIVTSASIG